MSPGNKADQDANRIQSMGKQERGQAFLKKMSDGDSRADEQRWPCLLSLDQYAWVSVRRRSNKSRTIGKPSGTEGQANQIWSET